MEDLFCKFIGYEVEGTAYISLWGGGHGTIKMNKAFVKDEKEIPSIINDGGFGCEKILYALVYVFAKYENGAIKFLYDKYVNLEDPEKEIPFNIKDLLLDAELEELK